MFNFYLFLIFQLFLSTFGMLCVGPGADNCQNEFYSDSQCQLVFHTNGVVNEDRCENDQSERFKIVIPMFCESITHQITRL
ncbi:unnamed protein product [Meloidogyne enterolobii]|uniref:Uncharacterized protein n=1 Tax=Meloidogyne enterolobii TaxID=390850 RepID=A0ACB0XW87_MELEN